MKEQNALSKDAIDIIEDLSDDGMGARTEYFTGAELAGLVRSAASFALSKAVESGFDENSDGMVTAEDLECALKEVRPALGTQDDVLKARYPFGISSECSSSIKRIKRDLTRFITPTTSITPRLNSLLLVGGSNSKGAGGVITGGAGCSALASWAGVEASTNGFSDFVRFITALDILTAEGGGGDEARATALVERFSEAREMSHSLLILDDIDQICAGSGPGAYSSIMLSTLRALLRTPPPSTNVAKAGGQSKLTNGRGKTLQIIATTSRTDAACTTLHEIFEETLVVPLLSDAKEVEKLLTDCLADEVADASSLAGLIIDRLGEVGCKTALRLAERAVLTAADKSTADEKAAQSEALEGILEDLVGDDAIAARVCQVEI
jgi:SpoVK/Ycf46/Vps4 family AAA+-type ATPase